MEKLIRRFFSFPVLPDALLVLNAGQSPAQSLPADVLSELTNYDVTWTSPIQFTDPQATNCQERFYRITPQ